MDENENYNIEQEADSHCTDKPSVYNLNLPIDFHCQRATTSDHRRPIESIWRMSEAQGASVEISKLGHTTYFAELNWSIGRSFPTLLTMCIILPRIITLTK